MGEHIVDDKITENDDDEEEEEAVIYVDPSMDLLPPRPLFIPCIPEGCFSFCFPLDEQHGGEMSTVEVDMPPGTNENPSTYCHGYAPPSTAGQATKSRPVVSSEGKKATNSTSVYSDDNYMEKIPILTSVAEDGDEASSSDGSDHSTSFSNRELFALHSQNAHLPGEIWMKFCQFLFTFLLMDGMRKLRLLKDERESVDDQPVALNQEKSTCHKATQQINEVAQKI